MASRMKDLYHQITDKRKENFSADEKKIIIDFVFQNKSILEDKSNSMRNKNHRQEKWKVTASTISSRGVTRNWKEIRGAYQRWKMQAKKNFAAHKRSLRHTGDGPYIPEPSPLDDMLREIVPEDFEEDENIFDSDAMRTECDIQQPEQNNTDNYLVDPITGFLISEELPRKKHLKKIQKYRCPQIFVILNLAVYEKLFLQSKRRKLYQCLKKQCFICMKKKYITRIHEIKLNTNLK